MLSLLNSKKMTTSSMTSLTLTLPTELAPGFSLSLFCGLSKLIFSTFLIGTWILGFLFSFLYAKFSCNFRAFVWGILWKFFRVLDLNVLLSNFRSFLEVETHRNRFSLRKLFGEIVRLCLAVGEIKQKKRKWVIFFFSFNQNNFLHKKGKNNEIKGRFRVQGNPVCHIVYFL